jgi:hypothetical protein
VGKLWYCGSLTNFSDSLEVTQHQFEAPAFPEKEDNSVTFCLDKHTGNSGNNPNAPFYPGCKSCDCANWTISYDPATETLSSGLTMYGSQHLLVDMFRIGEAPVITDEVVCACMYKCMYIYACIYVCKYLCMYMYVFMYSCIHVFVYSCIYECICVCMYVCMYVCMFDVLYISKYFYRLTHHLNIQDMPSHDEEFHCQFDENGRDSEPIDRLSVYLSMCLIYLIYLYIYLIYLIHLIHLIYLIYLIRLSF